MLHIDDERDIREIVAISLGLDPTIAVRGCASGKDGLAAAEVHDRHHDIEALGHLRENPQTAGIPVVFLTARAQSHELGQLKLLGAAAVICKTVRRFKRQRTAEAHDLLDTEGQGVDGIVAVAQRNFQFYS